MHIILIVLVMQTFLGAHCSAVHDIALIPASEDLYIDFKDMQIYDSSELVCDTGGPKKPSFGNISVIQFDISELKLSDEDIAILVLKAAYPGADNSTPYNSSRDFAGVSLLPADSNWSERSSVDALIQNLQPAFQWGSNNHSSQLSTCLDQDDVFAFDISDNLRNARSQGGRVSYLLIATSDKEYAVHFKSRDTFEGPFIIVMPYPSADYKSKEIGDGANASISRV